MARGSVERLPSGRFRAVVSGGRDPLTGRRTKLTETHRTEAAARQACERLSALMEADAAPDLAATVADLLHRWMDVVDHQVTTAHTTAWYVNQRIIPAVGTIPIRKLQHRVDLLDRHYVHPRRGRCYADHQLERQLLGRAPPLPSARVR